MPSDELRFINAVVGFCKGSSSGTWPAPLAPLGYVPCGFEREIKTILAGRDRTVTVDLICASGRTHHALCIEAKSATLDEDQARRYRSLTPSNLLSMGGLPPEITPARLTHDVAYLAASGNTPSLIRQFEAIEIAMPVVAGDEERFVLVRGTLGQSDVDAVFRAGVAVAERDWPRHYVSFKSDSPDADIVPFVMQGLARFIIRGRGCTIEELSEASVGHWMLCGAKERKALRAKIAGLANRAMREELADYIERPGDQPTWTATREPLTHPAQLYRLRQFTGQFVERMERNLPFAGDQLDFGAAFFDPTYDDMEEDSDELDEEP